MTWWLWLALAWPVVIVLAIYRVTHIGIQNLILLGEHSRGE